MPLAGIAADAGTPADGEMPCHSQNASDEEAPSSSCADMKGCCAAVLFSPSAEVRSPIALDERVVAGASLTAGFVPEPADRPPVAL